MVKKVKANSKKNQSNFLYVIGAAVVIVLLLAVVIYYSGDNVAGKATNVYAKDTTGSDVLPVKITFNKGETAADFKHNGKTYTLSFTGLVDGVLDGLGISPKAATVECTTDADCTSPQVCINSKCVTNVPATGCGDGTCDATETKISCPADCVVAVCGNNIVEGGEDCDGTDLNGQTCNTLNFFEGILTCGTDCMFDISACIEQGTNGLFAPPADGSWGSWEAEPLPTGFACVQTDDEEFGNQYVNNPFVKGTLLYTTPANTLAPAKDWALDQNKLAERYCNSNGQYMSRYYNCPSLNDYGVNVNACYCTVDAQCGAGWNCNNVDDYYPTTPASEGICEINT